MILFLDTETTGLVRRELPPISPLQPDLIQLAAILQTIEGKTISEVSLLVNAGVAIPVEATNVHGITAEHTEKFGCDPKAIAKLISNFFSKSTEVVAYNADYDMIVLGRFTHKHGEVPIGFNGVQLDPMKVSTDLCQLPGKYGRYKWPKLSEAAEILLGEKLDKAHDAMADLRMTVKLFWWLREQNLI